MILDVLLCRNYFTSSDEMEKSSQSSGDITNTAAAVVRKVTVVAKCRKYTVRTTPSGPSGESAY